MLVTCTVIGSVLTNSCLMTARFLKGATASGNSGIDAGCVFALQAGFVSSPPQAQASGPGALPGANDGPQQRREPSDPGAVIWDKAPASLRDADVDARFAAVQQWPAAAVGQPQSSEQAFWANLAQGQPQQRPAHGK